jgi:type II secretory pathway pseudopilin PulG
VKSRPATLAFTLLEAMIALIVLAGVASACLQLRAQSLRGRAAAAEATTRDAALEDLLTSAVAGLLQNPEVTRLDDDAVRIAWRGEIGGDPWEVTRELALRSNPVAALPTRDDDAQRPQEIWMTHWRATWRGRTIEEWRLP